MSFNELIRNESLAGMKRLLRTVKKQETLQNNVPMTFYGVTSNPPSTAEINALIDTPANVGTDFVGLIVDSINGRQWLVWTDASDWYSNRMGSSNPLVFITPDFYNQAGLSTSSTNILLSNFNVPDDIQYIICSLTVAMLSPSSGTEFYLSCIFPDNTSKVIATARLDEFGAVVIASSFGFIPAYNSQNIRLLVFANEALIGETYDLTVATIGYVP